MKGLSVVFTMALLLLANYLAGLVQSQRLLPQRSEAPRKYASERSAPDLHPFAATVPAQMIRQ
jgi:hypothetical protein